MRTLSRIFSVSFLVFFGLEFSVGQANNNNNSNQVQTQQSPPSQNQAGGGAVLSPGSTLPPDGAYEPQDAGHRRVVPPAYMRAADIMWKERIWRVIDTRQKMNQDLYYPVQKNANRISLFDLLKDGILSGEISAYNFNLADYDDYSERLTTTEVKGALFSTKTISGGGTGGNDTTINIEVTADKVTRYMIKEDWHFEKQRSVIDPRILWICPEVEAINKNTGEADPTSSQALFWINFQQIRPLLAKTPVFNGENDAEWRTFDDIFWKRQFASYIIEQNNVYNRPIQAYLKGVDALEEGNHIHDKIEGIESDMWQY